MLRRTMQFKHGIVSAVIVPSGFEADSQEHPLPSSFLPAMITPSPKAGSETLFCCWSEGIEVQVAGGASQEWLQVQQWDLVRYMTSLGPVAAPPQPRKCSPKFLEDLVIWKTLTIR